MIGIFEIIDAQNSYRKEKEIRIKNRTNSIGDMLSSYHLIITKLFLVLYEEKKQEIRKEKAHKYVCKLEYMVTT